MIVSFVSFIDSLARKFKGVLIIDEAYADFVDPDLSYDSIPLIRKHKNLLFLRTLSKGYSLAGLRFGYGIGDHELIAPMLFKTRDSYNTDYVSQKLASAALKSKNYAMTTWEKIRSSRIVLAESLSRLGLKNWPSQSNFILTQIPQEQQIIPLNTSEKEENSSEDNYEFEPEEDEILANLLPKNISTQIFKAMLENSASEQGSRMSAMDNATRNAGEMVDKLTIEYNRSRQAAITKELIEIISGAESL